MTKEEFLRIKASYVEGWQPNIRAAWEALIEEVENAHPEWQDRSVTLSRTDWVKLSAAWNYYNNPPFSSVQEPERDRIAAALREAKQ